MSRAVSYLGALMLFANMLVADAGAGTVAELEIHGFTPDGSVFVFEEFGVQDGSGFPFSNRFYVDVANDRFLPGSPVRVRIDDETASLEEARERSRSQGEAVVPSARLDGNRGMTVGSLPVTQLDGDPSRMVVNPRPVFPPIDPPLEFRLEDVYVQEPANCEGLGPVVGYRLLRMDAAPGGTTDLLHEDTAIPQSRGCPQAYRLGAVQTFFPDGGAPVYVVLIAVRSFGFEGPDYRWIAVPGRL